MAALPPLSSVLPMPYAFAKTGLLFGFVFMGIVAFANAFTAKMLLHSAAATHTDTYEACAEAVGGRAWKVRAPSPADGLMGGVCAGCRRVCVISVRQQMATVV